MARALPPQPQAWQGLSLRSLPLRPCCAAGVFGVGEHSDSGVLTLLLQQPGTSGLQARNSDGVWVDVPPIPGTLVVNIGELLQLATGAPWARERISSAVPRSL